MPANWELSTAHALAAVHFLTEQADKAAQVSRLSLAVNLAEVEGRLPAKFEVNLFRILQEALNLGVKGYLLKENAIAGLLAAIHRVASGDGFICPVLRTALLRRNAAWEALREQKVG